MKDNFFLVRVDQHRKNDYDLIKETDFDNIIDVQGRINLTLNSLFISKVKKRGTIA